jgi:hypothetical protein
MPENCRSVATEIQDIEITLDVLNDPSASASGSQPGIIRINNNLCELF